jgi:hypothetical protein
MLVTAHGTIWRPRRVAMDDARHDATAPKLGAGRSAARVQAALCAAAFMAALN